MKLPIPIRDINEFVARLKALKQLRRKQTKESLASKGKRQALTSKQRDEILRKTARRCHICGGKIGRLEVWQADHVFSHAHGGEHSNANYLPAHSVCNNYKWFYGAEEFQWILKLGVWTRTQIERGDVRAMSLAQRFVKYEQHRHSRRRQS